MQSHKPLAFGMNSGTSTPSISPSLHPFASVGEAESWLQDSTPSLDLIVRHDHLFEDCLSVLSLLFPQATAEWDLSQCKDGITNKLVKCTGSSLTVLVRAYGKKSELIIDRQRELLTFLIMSSRGLCPPLFGRFRNGFVYGWMEGRALNAVDLSDPHIGKLIARKLSEWHQIDLPGERRPCLFPTLRKWLKGIETDFDLKAEIDWLEGLIVPLESPVVFCHNDLLCGNIILLPEGAECCFIDFEYGSWNYGSFDVANHFCEWAGLECDYSRYPSEAQQLKWLKHYSGRISLREIKLFSLAAHLFWSEWALIQSQISDIAFDYRNYAALRLAEYHRLKQTL